MDDLIAILSDSDFDFTGQLQVVRAERRETRLELTLELRAFSGDFERQAWILSCAHERFSCLRSEPFYGIEIFADHVLLAPYSDAHVQLGMRELQGPAQSYFLGRTPTLVATRIDANERGWFQRI